MSEWFIHVHTRTKPTHTRAHFAWQPTEIQSLRGRDESATGISVGLESMGCM
jgi:hypothetical protein